MDKWAVRGGMGGKVWVATVLAEAEMSTGQEAQGLKGFGVFQS